LSISQVIASPRVSTNRTATSTRVLAAWNDQTGYRAGILAITADSCQIQDSVPLPTRAHGLTLLPNGEIMVVARRPGDWVLRWQPGQSDATPAPSHQLYWAEPNRQFNGHLVLHPNGQQLLSTETDSVTDQGLIGIRDRQSLRLLGQWPSGGRDPHQLMLNPAGTHLWVANGGISSRPETGRSRLANTRLDSSVCEISLATGQIERQWVLQDPWLSQRHFSYHPASQTLGVALQAEHPIAKDRLAAPVLAIIQTSEGLTGSIKTGHVVHDMLGYGGDICADGSGFWVSSPKGSRLTHYGLDGRATRALNLHKVCALSRQGSTVLAAGRQLAGRIQEKGLQELASPLQADNHWLVLS
jgi:hypothetical protein